MMSLGQKIGMAIAFFLAFLIVVWFYKLYKPRSRR